MKRFICRTTVGALVCTLPLFLGTGAGAAEISFTEAWQRVKASNELLQAEQANIERAEHERSANRDLYLPQLNLSAGYMYLDDSVELSGSQILDSISGSDDLLEALAPILGSIDVDPTSLLGLSSTISEREVLISGLSMLWPLYTGGRITAAQDIAKARVRESELQYQLKLRDRFEELSKRYFGVVFAEQIVATRLEVEASLKKHLDHATLLYKNGQVAEVERMQAEASYDRARVNRLKAEADRKIASTALNSMLAVEEPAQPATPLFVRDDLPLLESSINGALAGFPGLAIFDAKEEMVAGKAAVEKGKYFPEVAAVGNYSLHEGDGLAFELTPDWFVGVSVSLPLIDRSGRGGHYRAAKSLERRIDLLRSQARKDISLLVEKTWRETSQALAEYEGLKTSLKLAEETVVLRNKAFQQGLATSLDVIDANLFVASVKTQRSLAAYTYIKRLARLLTLSGDVGDEGFDVQLIEGE
ncbi:TolC family protein [Desulfosediminicola sp.]|uniref:TolC family protein n=1 Tax=Desulfosediminicola sp. TaxID=2886825 RepID=UPI003AF2B642